MAESTRTRLMRWLFNWWPCYRGTGGRVSHISADWREVRVKLKLGWRTRNYVGTIFGGSLYAAVDPFYMIMLMKNLGPGFIVWDKAARIRFRRPGRGRLTATFKLGEAELAEVKRLIETEPKLDRSYLVTLVDEKGEVCAEIEKVIYIGRKDQAHRG